MRVTCHAIVLERNSDARSVHTAYRRQRQMWIRGSANASNINEKMIKKIFLGKQKKFPNGQVVIPLNSAEGNPARDSFNKNIIGRSATQISSHWARLVFTGKGTQPQDLASDSEIVKTVETNQGAISYVDAASVTDKVKVIAKF